MEQQLSKQAVRFENYRYKQYHRGEKIDNVMKWPVITLGNIFSYILKSKKKISVQASLVRPH